MAKYGQWYVAHERNQPVVRRMFVDDTGRRRHERLARKMYAHLCSNEKALHEFVVRINGRDLRAEQAKEQFALAQAFVSHDLLDRFLTELTAQIPNLKDAKYLFTLLKREVLLFFITEKGKVDPVEWKMLESAWGEWLLKRKARPFAKKTLRHIIQVSNRFLDFLHAQHPKEYSKVELAPFSKARLQSHEANRILAMPEPIGRYISEGDWAKIIKGAKIELRPVLTLAYGYGLRRAEALGLRIEDVRNGALSVERQVCAVDPLVVKPVKDLDQRKVPHWFMTPDECYLLIASSPPPVHPDTLGEHWSALMKRLGMQYQLHDLRRTFITRALRLHSPVDVQHAAGHSNLETTMRYQQDDRNISEERFVPRKKPAA